MQKDAASKRSALHYPAYGLWASNFAYIELETEGSHLIFGFNGLGFRGLGLGFRDEHTLSAANRNQIYCGPHPKTEAE